MNDADGMARYTALEQRLLAAEYVRFDSHITSEGLIEVDLRGTFESTNEVLVVAFEGMFDGRPAEPTLQAGRTMRGGNGDATFDQDRPSHLDESLLLGLTRMGLLHNLAMLSAGAPPDRSDGTLESWVVITDVRESIDTLDGTDVRVLRFALTVDGRTGGTATLYLEAATDIPLRREQTVAFEAGEMRVVERYAGFVVTP